MRHVGHVSAGPWIAVSASRTSRTPLDGSVGRFDHRPVDAVERVVADLGLAGHEQRVGQEGRGVLGLTAVDRDLRPAQQRQGLAGDGADPAVQPGALGEVAVGLVEPPGEDPRFAAQGQRERMAAGGAEAPRLGGEARRRTR